MKTVKIFTLLSVLIFAFGCMSNYNILKENPSSPNLSGMKTIYVGWLDLREGDSSAYGFERNNWATEIGRHNIEGLQVYLRDALPGKKIIGATSKADMYPGNADLQLQFKLKEKIKYQVGFTIACELKVDVNFLDGKTGKVLYAASVMSTCAAPFPKNWKANSFDGALDNDIYNLAVGIAEKLK